MSKPEDSQHRDVYPDRLLDGRVYKEVTSKTIDLAFRSYRTARILNIVSFATGIGLLCSAVVLAILFSDVLWLSISLGAFGTINLVALLIAKPVQSIQEGVNALLQSQIACMNFAASYEAVARYLVASSELPFDDPNRNLDREFEQARFLMNSAINCLTIESIENPNLTNELKI